MWEFNAERSSASAARTKAWGETSPHPALPRKRTNFVREVRFSTRSFASDLQFDTWRGLMRGVADLDPLDETQRKNGYLFEVNAYDLGKIGAAFLRSDGSVFRRGADHVRRGSPDHWALCYRSSGGYRSESGSRRLDAGPESLWMTSLAYPFEGRAEPGDTLALYIARDRLLSVAGELDRLNHRLLHGVTAQIAKEFMRSMAKLLPTTPAAEVPILVETALIVFQGFIEQADPLDVNPTRPMMAVRLEMVKRYVQENLRSGRLEPDDICAAMRLSRRQLYYLFEKLGGVSVYVRSRRLLAVHEAIASPSEHRPIHAIAAEFGFHDAALFSRQFKAEFGYSPSDSREASQTGFAAPRAAPQNYADWLAQIAKH